MTGMDREAPPLLFALEASRGFGERVAAALGPPLATHEERGFEDGEHKARPLQSVRGRDVYVLQSLHGDAEQSPNDKLCRLLFLIGALKDADAGRVTALVPYLAYARKDRRTKSRDPVTSRYVAQLFEAVGADRVVVMDVHNLAAFQNAFRCRTEHLEARGLFARHLAGRVGEAPLVVVSPDAGGTKRADDLRGHLARRLGRDVGLAFMEKKRSEGVVSGEAVIGEVRGRVAVIVDDLIATGTTMARAAQACRQRGALAVHALATHGLFSAEAERVLGAAPFDSIVVTDTVPPLRLSPDFRSRRLTVLDAAPLFAEAVRRLHAGGSIVDLLEG
jgi:ribose-phosphate pyrophosphokinase